MYENELDVDFDVEAPTMFVNLIMIDELVTSIGEFLALSKQTFNKFDSISGDQMATFVSLSTVSNFCCLDPFH
jgi:hypothetical protein